MKKALSANPLRPMETVFFFKNMDKSEEEMLREYFLSKLPKFEKILSHFPEDGVFLQVKGEKFQKHSAYEVELIIKLPLGTISAKEASHAINKAVDLAKDRLDMQLKKMIGTLRRGHRAVKVRNKIKFKISAQI